MTVDEAIMEVVKKMEPGDTFSLLWLTEQVKKIRGHIVTDGTVSRILRYFNEGRYDNKPYSVSFRYEVVRKGVYRITRVIYSDELIDRVAY